MNKKAIARLAKKVWHKTKDNAPAILMVVGCTTAVGGAVLAAVATTKIEPVIEDATIDIQHLKNTRSKMDDNGEMQYVDQYGITKTYTMADYRKDLVMVYVKAGVKLGKIYAPAILTEAASVSAMIWSFDISRKRHAAATAACLAAETAFKKYRDRVIEDYGEQYDEDVRFGRHRVTEEVPVLKKDGTVKTDKNGEVKTVPVETVKGFDTIGTNAFWFDETCRPFFTGSWAVNESYVIDTFNELNFRLVNDGFIFLNDIYRAFGRPYSTEKMNLGLIYDPHDRTGAHSLSSKTAGKVLVPKIFSCHNGNLSDEDFEMCHQKRDAFLIDFEIDGNIVPYIDMVMYPKEEIDYE